MKFKKCLKNDYLFSILKNRNMWGRHGFDVGYKLGGACRGAVYLVNTTAFKIVANDENYALAA